MKQNVEVKDLGLFKIESEIEKFKNSSVKVGVLSNAGKNDDNVDIVDYATWNENGVASKKGGWKIPPRPFIKGWANNAKKDKLIQLLSDLFSMVLLGKLDSMTALKRLGKYGKSSIQSYIRRGGFTPNAPSTIRKKKSTVPLIDSGTLRKAIDFEIVGVDV